MNFDTLLSMGAFAVSVGGLVPVFVIDGNQRKQAAIAIVMTLLLCLTGVMLFRSIEHDRAVRSMQVDIVTKLSDHEWTLEQLFEELHYPDRTLFFEALFRAVADGAVEDRLGHIQASGDSPVAIRLYHVSTRPAGETQARD